MTSTVVEYENVMSHGFSDINSFQSGALSRWERKQKKASSHASSSSENVNGRTRKPLGDNNFNGGDRFIPNRGSMDIEMASHSIRSSSCAPISDDGETSSSADTEYKSALSGAMLGTDENDKNSHRILSFKEKAPQPTGDAVNHLKILYSSSAPSSYKANSQSSKLVSRHIPSAPSRILDAPDLLDDYYLNLLSFNDNNILAIALAQTLYLWDATTGDINELFTLGSSTDSDAHISSVQWVQEGGNHIAVGTHDGQTRLWDVAAQKQLRSMDGHTERVSALSWSNHILSTGGRDSIVVNHDVRVANHNIATLSSHTQEVCGLAWSPDGMTLASGANDNTLCLWNAASSSSSDPRFKLTEHQAAVKALAWSPHERNLLASGGGTADRTIKFWNAQTGAHLNSIDTGSQVCNLLWNPHENEILSSHGFARNQLCLWKYPSMAKVKELEGHTARVLHMACNPNTGTVVSAAADETLRFWDIFGPPTKSGKRSGSSRGGNIKNKKLSKAMHIR